MQEKSSKWKKINNQRGWKIESREKQRKKIRKKLEKKKENNVKDWSIVTNAKK